MQRMQGTKASEKHLNKLRSESKKERKKEEKYIKKYNQNTYERVGD